MRHFLKGWPMKKLFSLLLLPITLLCLTTCGNRDKDETTEYQMIAEIVKIEDKIEVTVVESPIADGPYLVITGEDTAYQNAKEKSITRDDLAVGDTVLITYSGQVMMSYPPQIVALSIKVQ